MEGDGAKLGCGLRTTLEGGGGGLNKEKREGWRGAPRPWRPLAGGLSAKRVASHGQHGPPTQLQARPSLGEPPLVVASADGAHLGNEVGGPPPMLQPDLWPSQARQHAVR